MSRGDDRSDPGQWTGQRRREPIVNAPAVVVALVAALVGVYAISQFVSTDAQDNLIGQFAFVPARLTLAFFPHALDSLRQRANGGPEALQRAQEIRSFLYYYGGAKPWTLLTYAFLHGGWAHVGLNSVWIIAFGPPVARRLGPARFLALFAATAIAGALTHWLFNMMDFTPVIGASAADSGLMAAAARFIFEPGGPLGGSAGFSRANDVADFNQPAPPLRRLLRERRVLMFLGVWLVANFVFGAGAKTLGFADGPVAWLAHMGGFAMGLFGFPLFDRPSPPPPLETPLGDDPRV
jgi:membrane associated rhomboid family serine protease